MPRPSFDSPLSKLDFVAFDTETTGLSATQDRVVEIAAWRFRLHADGGSELDRLVDPARSIPEAAARVHGIRDKDVKGKPPVGQVLPEFAAFFEGAVLLAHNAEFDVGFLCQEAGRAGVELPDVPVLDTVDLSRRMRSDLPNHKLQTLSRALGCEAEVYHRALDDARTLAEVFRRLLSGPLEQGSLGELIGATNGAMTFGPPDGLRMWLPPQLQSIEEAIRSQSKVTIVYSPEGRRDDSFDVVPLGYIRRPGGTHLMARRQGDPLDKPPRPYRLDAIRRAHFAQADLF